MSRSSDFEVILITQPSHQLLYLTVALWAFVTRYSGVTVRDFHPFPYSPQTVVRGTHIAYSREFHLKSTLVGSGIPSLVSCGQAEEFFGDLKTSGRGSS